MDGEAVIKLSPSDVERSDSDSDTVEGDLLNPDFYFKKDRESGDEDFSGSQSDNHGSVASEEQEQDKETSEDESRKKKNAAPRRKDDDVNNSNKNELLTSSTSKRGPGRPPKKLRRLNASEGSIADGDGGDSSDGADEPKPEMRPGFGYPVEFKMKVLKYSDTHSNAATSEKFGIPPKRIREWISSRRRIEKVNTGHFNRRPRRDGFTVEQKLQAVALSTERSIGEAKRRYKVDRTTIGRWKAKKRQLEARLLRGEGKLVRESGAGRKPQCTKIEDSLRAWYIDQRSKDITITYKMILSKAKALMDEDPSLQGMQAPRSWCWVTGFLKRQNLQDTFGKSLNHTAKSKCSKQSDVSVKEEVEYEDNAFSNSSVESNDDDNFSSSWKCSSDNSDHEVVKKEPKTVLPAKSKKRTPKIKENRDAPKSSSEEDDQIGRNPESEIRIGATYPVHFRLRVIKYAETHTSATTARKFEVSSERVRHWKKTRHRIEEESKGRLTRRPRSGFTIEDKLQAVAFAAERSMDEARLLYNVDKTTLGRWKRKKEEFEERLSKGEGNSMKPGAGMKPKYAPIEEKLRDWILALRLRGVRLNWKMILNEAKTLIDETPSMRDMPYPRTHSWVTGFLMRHNLEGLLGNKLGHISNMELNTDEVKRLAEQLVAIPENPIKRIKRTITLEDKVNIIKRIEQGETQGTVAKSLNTATSTIQTIWSKREEILHKYATPKSKTRSDPMVWKEYSSIGSALLDWLEQTTSKSIKVNSGMLMDRAVQLSETYKLSQFSTEAKQWIRIFCKRHKLSSILAETRGGSNVNASLTSTSVTQHESSQMSNASINSIDSSNDHDDNHLSFDFSNFIPKESAPPPQPQLQPPLFHPVLNTAGKPAHFGFSNETLHHQPVSMLPSTSKQSVISTNEAVKCYNLLRTWIHANYGTYQDVLNSHLSGVENNILKMGHASNN